MDRQIARRRRLKWVIVQTRIGAVFAIVVSLFAGAASVADLIGLTHYGSPKVSVLVWLGAAGLSAFFWDLSVSRARERLSALDAHVDPARPLSGVKTPGG